jgi:hypothetical protein
LQICAIYYIEDAEYAWLEVALPSPTRVDKNFWRSVAHDLGLSRYWQTPRGFLTKFRHLATEPESILRHVEASFAKGCAVRKSPKTKRPKRPYLLETVPMESEIHLVSALIASVLGDSLGISGIFAIDIEKTKFLGDLSLLDSAAAWPERAPVKDPPNIYWTQVDYFSLVSLTDSPWPWINRIHQNLEGLLRIASIRVQAPGLIHAEFCTYSDPAYLNSNNQGKSTLQIKGQLQLLLGVGKWSLSQILITDYYSLSDFVSDSTEPSAESHLPAQ